MKHLFAISGVVVALGFASPSALAQSAPPALPSLTQQQAQALDRRIEPYRRATDARVARNEITADEASRLVAWREWQIAQQIAVSRSASLPATNAAPPDYRDNVPPDYRDNVPPDYRDNVPPDYRSSAQPGYYVTQPAPVYGPYYRPAPPYYPYYYGPRPNAYWGPTVCAGGFGRHFGGRICF